MKKDQAVIFKELKCSLSYIYLCLSYPIEENLYAWMLFCWFFFPPEKKTWHDIQWIWHTETCVKPIKKTGVAQVNPQEQNEYNSSGQVLICMTTEHKGLISQKPKRLCEKEPYGIPLSVKLWVQYSWNCEHILEVSLFHYCMQKCLIVWKPIHSTPKTSNSNIKLSTRKTFFPFPKPLGSGETCHKSISWRWGDL